MNHDGRNFRREFDIKADEKIGLAFIVSLYGRNTEPKNRPGLPSATTMVT